MTPGHVYFVGAGPGAPDLLTLRGKALIERADLIIYADSLVDPALCELARPAATVVGSSSLTLEEITERMITAAQAGQTVVRLQSGEPALYGAMHEQLERLDAAEVPWSIVPGVSSGFAAAARLGVELTVPEVAQTVILTRASGRASKLPAGEDLASLAAHGATLVIFLGMLYLKRIVRQLREGGYPPETPVAIAYRVSWPDEAIIEGTLVDIEAKAAQTGWTKQAVILVGPALGRTAEGAGRRSRLYSPEHSHLFRRSKRLPQPGAAS